MRLKWRHPLLEKIFGAGDVSRCRRNAPSFLRHFSNGRIYPKEITAPAPLGSVSIVMATLPLALFLISPRISLLRL